MNYLEIIYPILSYSFLENQIIYYIRFFLILLLTGILIKFSEPIIRNRLMKRIENKEFFFKETLFLYLIPIVKFSLFSIGIYFAIAQIQFWQKEEIFKKDPSLIGMDGVCYSSMKPFGKVLINDIVYQASSVRGFVKKDQKIKVVDVKENGLVVKSI